MSKLADEIIKKLFTDWKGKPVPRLIQEGTGGAGWSENAVRAVIKAAEQSVQPTRRSVAQKEPRPTE
jgi:hypothetical protein